VAHDPDLPDRVRAALAGEVASERRMFGGLGFLVGGHLAVAASSQGGLMVRVDPRETEALLAQPGVEQVVMGSRAPMRGWVRVAAGALVEDDALSAWVQRGLAVVRGLPPG
jgi:TfoX/Sxy family transcriptional regulator of competence genes